MPVKPASGALEGSVVRSACWDSAAARAGAVLRDGALLVDAAGAAMRISLRVKEMPSIKGVGDLATFRKTAE